MMQQSLSMSALKLMVRWNLRGFPEALENLRENESVRCLFRVFSEEDPVQEYGRIRRSKDGIFIFRPNHDAYGFEEWPVEKDSYKTLWDVEISECPLPAA